MSVKNETNESKDSKCILTLEAKVAVRDYMLKIVVIPSVFLVVLSGFAGYFIRDIAEVKAYHIAYTKAFDSATGHQAAALEKFTSEVVKANIEAELAAKKVAESARDASEACKRISDSELKVIDALQKANSAELKATQAAVKAAEANKNVTEAENSVNEAYKKISDAEHKIALSLIKANTADKKSIDAENNVNELNDKLTAVKQSLFEVVENTKNEIDKTVQQNVKMSTSEALQELERAHNDLIELNKKINSMVSSVEQLEQGSKPVTLPKNPISNHSNDGQVLYR